jgi:hypothetical protein
MLLFFISDKGTSILISPPVRFSSKLMYSSLLPYFALTHKIFILFLTETESITLEVFTSIPSPLEAPIPHVNILYWILMILKILITFLSETKVSS